MSTRQLSLRDEPTSRPALFCRSLKNLEPAPGASHFRPWVHRRVILLLLPSLSSSASTALKPPFFAENSEGPMVAEPILRCSNTKVCDCFLYQSLWFCPSLFAPLSLWFFGSLVINPLFSSLAGR